MSDSVQPEAPGPENPCTALMVLDKRKKELMLFEKAITPLEAHPWVLTELCASAEPQVAHAIALYVPQIWHFLYRLAEGAAGGVGLAASKHLYKKLGESIVDKALDAAKHLPHTQEPPAPALYGPDGRPLVKGR